MRKILFLLLVFSRLIFYFHVKQVRNICFRMYCKPKSWNHYKSHATIYTHAQIVLMSSRFFFMLATPILALIFSCFLTWNFFKLCIFVVQHTQILRNSTNNFFCYRHSRICRKLICKPPFLICFSCMDHKSSK
jgi:hypothetical protein